MYIIKKISKKRYIRFLFYFLIVILGCFINYKCVHASEFSLNNWHFLDRNNNSANGFPAPGLVNGTLTLSVPDMTLTRSPYLNVYFASTAPVTSNTLYLSYPYKNFTGDIFISNTGYKVNVSGYSSDVYLLQFVLLSDNGNGLAGIWNCSVNGTNCYYNNPDVVNFENWSGYYAFYKVLDVKLSDVRANTQNISNIVTQEKIDSLNQSIVSGNSAIQNKLDDVKSSVDSLESNINDSNTSGSQSTASTFFKGFTTNTFGLTSIITAPLTLIGNITSSSCSALELPLPFVNRTLSLPCMSTIYSQYFGAFFSIYQTITFGIVAYWVCVRIFNLVKDFKNPEHDEIEVLDL